MADYVATLDLDDSKFLAGLRNADRAALDNFANVRKAAQRDMGAASVSIGKVGQALDGDLKKRGAAAFQALKEGAEGFGGAVGGSVSMVEKFGKALMESSTAGGLAATALGGAALAAGVYAFAVSEVTTSTLEAIRASEDWVDELQAAGIVIDRSVTGPIEEMNRSLDGLTLQSKAAGVEVVAGIVVPLQSAANAAGIMLDAFDQVLPGMNATTAAGLATGNVITDMIPGMRFLANWGEIVGTVFPEAADGMLEFRDATRDTADTIDQVGVGLSDWLRVMPTVQGALKEFNNLARERNQQEEEYARALKESQKEALRNFEQVKKLAEEEEDAVWDRVLYYSELRRQQREQAREYQEQADLAVEGLEDLSASLDDLDRSEIWKRFAADIATVVDMLSNQMFSALSNINQIMSQGTDRELQKIKTYQDVRRRSFEEQRDAIESNDELSEKTKQAEIRRLEETFQAGNTYLTRRQAELQKAALKQWKTEKALSVTEAIINGAVGVTMALATVPPPFNAIAAAAITASVGTQVALIQSQQPPTFPTGGNMADRLGPRVDADHYLVGIQPEESVLTGRGTSAVGGAAGVDALNAGRGMGPTMIEIHLPGGVVASAIVNDRATQRAVIQITEAQLRKKGIR